jgi:hypothetical protein
MATDIGFGSIEARMRLLKDLIGTCGDDQMWHCDSMIEDGRTQLDWNGSLVDRK